MEHIEKACVVGAGTMGHGIAFVLARAGISVVLIDRSNSVIERAHNDIENMLARCISKESLNEFEAQRIRSHIATSCSLDDLAGAQLMIEAVNEDLELKRHIFATADAVMDEDSLLATNTSSISITSIASTVVNKHRVLGLHFFNPPNIMKLLEIVIHDDISFNTIEQAKILGLRLRKECIVVKDSPGFATSRLGISFALEAMRMLQAGVAGVLDLDAAMKLGYGHPMGPLMLSDWVGLDVRLAISEQLYQTLDSAVFAPPDILRRMVRAGFLGRKSGTGFYEWNDGRSLGVSQSVLELCSTL